MVDVALSAVVSRDLLGLGPLEVARGSRYYCSPQFFGAMVTWNRQRASSPFFDDEITTQRSRQKVNEQLVFEVKGPDLATLKVNMDELTDALLQDSYTITVTAEGATFAYACETADYQSGFFVASRMVARQAQMSFAVPRSPLPLSAGVV